jgi:hypothetical protein
MKVYGAMLESLSLITGVSEATLVQNMMEQISQVRLTSPAWQPMSCVRLTLLSSLSMEFVAETLLEAALTLCKTLDDSVTLKRSLANAKKAGLSTTIASQLDGRISQIEQNLIEDLVKSERRKFWRSVVLRPF